MNIDLQSDESKSMESEDWAHNLANSEQRLRITLTNDFAFKTVFRNKKALTGLLSALLEINVKDIKKIEIVDRFLPGEYPEDKEGILDVKVRLNNNVKINIEIQVACFPYWEERSLFYTAKYFVEDFLKGKEYGELDHTIHISILSFNLNQEGLYAIYELRSRDSHQLYSDKFSLRVLQLKKLNEATQEEQQTEIYHWAKMITADDWEVLLKMAEHNDYMKAAVEEMEHINTEKEMRYQYLQREKKLHDDATIRSYYMDVGLREGMKEGMIEGCKKGGNYALEAAILLKNHHSIEKIMEITGFSQDYLEKLNQLVSKE